MELKRANDMTSHHGYTLIEILIVIFIMSIAASVALLSIQHNENKQMEAIANELNQMVTLAEEQAMLQPKILGLSVKANTFQFTSLESTEEGKKYTWVPLHDTVLGKHTVPDN